MSNINGYCPNCKADFDGDLIIETFISQGNTENEAINIAKNFSGWEQHGILNRWSNCIGLSNWDNHIGNKCPYCLEEFKVVLETLK